MGDYLTAQEDAKYAYQLSPSQKSNKIYTLIHTRQKDPIRQTLEL